MQKVVNQNNSFFPAGDMRLHALNFSYSVASKSSPGGRDVRQQSWSMDYHFSQTGALKVAGMAQKLMRPAGSLFLYPPDLLYREYLFIEDLPCPMTYIVFEGESSALHKLTDNLYNFAMFNDARMQLAHIFKKIHQRSLSGSLSGAMFQSFFFEIIDLLINGSRKNGDFTYQLGGALPEKIFSRRVNDYLRRNIAGKISLKSMASELGVSESTMTHKYRAESNCTPMQYLMNLRIGMAKSLLLKGESLAEIALKSGFYDEYHLSKSFRRRTGLSPRAYKNRSGMEK